MSEIIPFKPLGEVEAEERLRQFVEHYRPLVTLLPYVTSFEENIWDLRGKYFQASAGNDKLSIRFVKFVGTDQRQATEPFDQPFLDFAKAYALHLMATNKQWRSHGGLSSLYLPVIRQIEDEFHKACPSEPPCIKALTPELCEAINASIRCGKDNAGGKYRKCITLNQIVQDLQHLGLNKERFTWSGKAVRPEETHMMVCTKGDKARQAMLPSLEAMGAMAYCFEHAEGPREKWVSAINGFLSGHPARLGECWFLGEDCQMDMEIQGQQRYGLRWWPQKRAKPMVKEFLANDCFVPVFQRGFEWLTEISSPARRMAKWMEKNPGKLHLTPEFEHLRSKETLTVAEAASIRRVREQSFLVTDGWARRKGLDPVIDPVTGEKGIRFEDLERAVLSDLPHGFPWFHQGKNLKYSDMLILIREDEFDSRRTTSTTMFVVPTCDTYYHSLDAMVDRHGLIEADGSPVRVRSHQFRHLNETIAYKHGVDRAWMNRHAGRARTSHEESYDDRTDAEKLAQTSVVSVHQRICGDMLMVSEPNRPKTHAEIMAEVESMKRTGYVHVTDKGACCHDFTESPCKNFRDCLYCSDHLCIKGIPLWDKNVRAACAMEMENLENALEAAKHEMYGVNEHIEDLLLPRATYARQVLHLLDDPTKPSGTGYGHAPSEDPYDPLSQAMKLHIETMGKKGHDVSWLERGLKKLQDIHAARAKRPTLPGGGLA